jgi:hypothetical protein
VLVPREKWAKPCGGNEWVGFQAGWVGPERRGVGGAGVGRVINLYFKTLER